MAEVIKLKMTSYYVRVGPNPVAGILVRRRKFGHRHTERRPGRNTRRRWSSTCQGEKPQKKPTPPTKEFQPPEL